MMPHQDAPSSAQVGGKLFKTRRWCAGSQSLTGKEAFEIRAYGDCVFCARRSA
jgi:hypothetical protein